MQLGNYVLSVKSIFVRQGHHVLPHKTTTACGLLIAAALILAMTSCSPQDFNSVPLSADDYISRQFRPQIWPDKMFNVFIHNKGADKTVRCDFVGLFASRGTYIYRRVVRISSQGLYCFQIHSHLGGLLP